MSPLKALPGTRILNGILLPCLFIASSLYAASLDEAADATVRALVNPDTAFQGIDWTKIREPQMQLITSKLLAELQGPDRDRRNLAACALKRHFEHSLREREVAEALSTLLRLDPEGISSCATDAVLAASAASETPLKISVKEAPPLLRVRGYYRDKVVDPLAGIGEPVVPHLIERLSHREERKFAIHILSRMGPKAVDAVPHLRKLLWERGASVSSAEALLKIVPNDPEAIRVIVAEWDRSHGNWSFDHLATLKDVPQVHRVLTEALESKDPGTRRSAARALGKPLPDDEALTVGEGGMLGIIAFAFLLYPITGVGALPFLFIPAWALGIYFGHHLAAALAGPSSKWGGFMRFSFAYAFMVVLGLIYFMMSGQRVFN